MSGSLLKRAHRNHSRGRPISYPFPPSRNNARLGALNDSRRLEALRRGVSDAVSRARAGLACLSVSDGSLPALIAADLGAEHVYTGVTFGRSNVQRPRR
jgi:hypothetical protein